MAIFRLKNYYEYRLTSPVGKYVWPGCIKGECIEQR